MEAQAISIFRVIKPQGLRVRLASCCLQAEGEAVLVQAAHFIQVNNNNNLKKIIPSALFF